MHDIYNVDKTGKDYILDANRKSFSCDDDDDGRDCGDCHEKEALNPIKYLFRKKRTLYFKNLIVPPATDILMMQMMELDDTDPSKPIKVIFDSPGGSLGDGLKLYDWMQQMQSPVHIHCYNEASSMGAVLLATGAPGHRYLSPSARTMLHLPKRIFASEQGLDPKDMEIATKQLELNYERLIDILSFHTGQKSSKIKADIDRDFWMGAHESVAYGLADKVIEHKKGFYSQNKGPVASALERPTKKLGSLVGRAKKVFGAVGKALKDGQ